jgi:hypothetical protein
MSLSAHVMAANHHQSFHTDGHWVSTALRNSGTRMRRDAFFPSYVQLPRITNLAIICPNSCYLALELFMSYIQKMWRQFSLRISKVSLAAITRSRELTPDNHRLWPWSSLWGFLPAARQRNLYAGRRRLEAFKRALAKTVYSNTVPESRPFSGTRG